MEFSVIILAAGRGARMRPLTDAIPKPMAPFLNTTLIGHGISKLIKQVSDIYVTVGHHADLLAKHSIEQGASVIINTSGKGNAWWLRHALIRQLDRPLVVLTADNICELSLSSYINEFSSLPSQTCMIVPVSPIPGVEGDFLKVSNKIYIESISRLQPQEHYASGVQILNPINLQRYICDELFDADYSFNQLWKALINDNCLYSSRLIPKNWFSVDTLDQLLHAESIIHE
mgnify:CR=1 FL=1